MARTPEEEAEYQQLKKDLGQEALNTFGFNDKDKADVSVGTRALSKNFGATPEEQMGYIRRERPDLDVALKDGEVYAKPHGKMENYKPMDLPFSPLSDPLGTIKDIPQDLLDIGYDVPAGFAQGALTTLGGLVAAPTGPGAIAAASAASAASGGGLESLKQYLGKSLGVNKEMHPEEIAKVAAISAAMPTVGRWASTGYDAAKSGLSQVAQKMAGMTKEQAKQFIKNNPEVMNLVKMLSSSEGLPEADKMAYDSIKNLKEAVLKANLMSSDELEKKLAGKSAEVNLSELERLLSETQHKGASGIVSSLRNRQTMQNQSSSPMIEVPGTDIRKLRQAAQFEADFGKGTINNPATSAKNAEYGDLQRYLGAQESSIDEAIPAIKEEIQRNIPLQESLEAGSNNPLAFLKSSSDKNLITIARAAQKAGNKETVDLANRLGAARSITGSEKKGPLESIKKWGARKGMTMGDSVSEGIEKVSPYMPRQQQLWIELMNELNKQGNTTL